MDIIVAIGGLCILAWWTRLFLNDMKYTPKIKIKDKKIENQ
ncbi:hypothetical protein SAMN02745781_00590 [Vibrio gazogenes DSM 21264]|uniref:Uncharacterized protein n=1 Tax=Vibrio gazogenes DSM 21264 = NBRC 103151 TaxID=1123492 RepID=A0A1M4UXS3_VIBGA|nr:hypothetical protein SAMN02745781_00590 [Vibrio gazogenes DSM 21264] [Vibrio gazogenes DSM 21264 = NBRC 103151]SJN58094.1 hypothetical protein BQ6471_02866 [Vibrio gazogenes]